MIEVLHHRLGGKNYSPGRRFLGNELKKTSRLLNDYSVIPKQQEITTRSEMNERLQKALRQLTSFKAII